MNARTVLSRLRPWTGPLVILVAVGLGYYILGTNYPEVYNGYDGISRALGYFYTLAPAIAGYAAWDMSRFRALLGHRGRTGDLWRTALRRLSVPTLLTLLSVLLLMGYHGGLSTSQTWAGIILAVLQTFLWAFFGTAVGISVPPVISLPVAVFIPWFLTGYPAAMSDPVWRQMFGQPNSGCCTVDSMIDPVTVRSSVVTLGLLLLVCLILIQVRFAGTAVRGGGTATAVVLALAAVAVGHSLGQSGNFMDSVARSSDARICDEHSCIWPESDRTMVDTNLRVAGKLGVPVGTVLVDGEPRNDNELWMSGEVKDSEVEQRLLVQLIERSPELRAMASCWVDEMGRPLSLADEAVTVYDSRDLIRTATDADGRFLGYSSSPDPAAWNRLADLINRDSRCTA